MVVMTAKVSKTKVIAVICILAAIIAIAAVVLSGGTDDEAGTVPTVKADTNEGRIAFLQTYGWEVDPQPAEVQEVTIPQQMDEVLAKYNELQRSQGYDLSRFAGKQVTRYVYAVTNYEGASAPVYATLLVHKDQVIGGDVTSTGGRGLMHGFERPASAKPAAPAVTETEPEPAQTVGAENAA